SLLCLFAGCGRAAKEAPIAPVQESPSADTNETVPTARRPKISHSKQSPAAVAPETEVLAGAVHAFMTAQLRVFVREKGRLPENFTEFTSTRMDSVPRAPDGFRWDI